MVHWAEFKMATIRKDLLIDLLIKNIKSLVHPSFTFYTIKKTPCPDKGFRIYKEMIT